MSLNDEDPTMERLRSVASTADPVPSLVMDAARAAFGLRRLDAEIAELLHDSAVDADLVLVRGTADARMLSFASGSVSVEAQLTETSPGVYALLAFISGALGDVLVEHIGGSVSVPLDDAGRLVVDDVPAGRLRLHLVTFDGAAVTTSWITA